MSSGSGGVVDDRELIEDSVEALIAVAPPGWRQLTAVFAPGAQNPVATAQFRLGDGTAQAVAVPDVARSAMAQHQRRAEAGGTPWRQMTIDCTPDGQLSVRTGAASARAKGAGPPRSLHWVLAGITVACAVAAAAVFAFGWRTSPPPRADIIDVPPAPARQGEVFAVMEKWYEAANAGDAAGMWALTCAHPAPPVVDEIESIEAFGQVTGIAFPVAVVDFREDSDHVWAQIALRVRPISPEMMTDVRDAQSSGGFLKDQYIYVEEDGVLKVCDSDLGAS